MFPFVLPLQKLQSDDDDDNLDHDHEEDAIDENDIKDMEADGDGVDPPWPQLEDMLGLKNVVQMPSKGPIETKRVFRYVPGPDGNFIKRVDPNAVLLTVDVLHYGKKFCV